MMVTAKLKILKKTFKFVVNPFHSGHVTLQNEEFMISALSQQILRIVTLTEFNIKVLSSVRDKEFPFVDIVIMD